MFLLARTRDEPLDLHHLRDQLSMQSLKAGGVDDTLRFAADVARVFDDCSGPGQQGISISGH